MTAENKRARYAALKSKHAQQARASAAAASDAQGIVMYPPDEERRIRKSWARLMRWSRNLRQREAARGRENKVTKVVVFGGGSFGTAMGVALSRQHPDLHVILLLRDPYLCKDINERHCNSRYLPDYELPLKVTRRRRQHWRSKGRNTRFMRYRCSTLGHS